MRIYFLVTPRLGFSTWDADDLGLARQLWGDPQVTRLISASGVFTEEQIEQRLQKEIENMRRYGVQYWPVFLLETRELAGCCGLRPYGTSPGVLELGVHLLPRCWGKGLASEACGAVMAHAFRSLGASALFAGHNPGNYASAAMLQRLGFRYTHDEYYEPTGLSHPSYLLTKEEYETQSG